MRPRAREEGLLVEELPDETLVYDLERHRAYCLNKAAGFVWRHSDGRTSVARMSRLMAQQLGTPADESFVWLAVDRLAKARLIEGAAEMRREMPRQSRRELIRKLGVSAVLLPLVSVVLAPTAAQAATCITTLRPGDTCPPGTPCGVLCNRCDGQHTCTPSGGNPTCKCQGGGPRCNPPTNCP